jgi:hypothetical protein
LATELYDHQKEAIDKLRNGSILCGGVGSGKSLTSIAYYYFKVCYGRLKTNNKCDTSKMTNPKNLYIITTAKKRDSLEWERELSYFALSPKVKNIHGVTIKIDSWNNIKKYKDIKDSFFIFDEQRLVGSGTWVKNFLKISKTNKWILLTATPGDTWCDYIPVFVANGFYKNRTQFLKRHALYNRFTKYPQIDKFIEEEYLLKLKDKIVINMAYQKPTISNNKSIFFKFDLVKYNKCFKDRWNIYTNKPIKSASELCYLLRKIVNSDITRIEYIINLINSGSNKLIIFYNFDYELELLRTISNYIQVDIKEWNGHKHEEVPNSKCWIYLVQYTAGAEGWNCIETDSIVFYSQNYSYKIMVQAAGRIDRLNTSYKNLFYYHFKSESTIDVAISNALKKKKTFNANNFTSQKKHGLG